MPLASLASFFHKVLKTARPSLRAYDVHPVKGFPPRDRYKKLTGLWTSGSNFKKPVRRAVKPQKFVITEVPSKDRSHTPRGFARAVCLANYQHV